jgi:amino acid transporter
VTNNVAVAVVAILLVFLMTASALVIARRTRAEAAEGRMARSPLYYGITLGAATVCVVVGYFLLHQ